MKAAANPTIFYSAGQARTIRDVYRVLVSKHEAGDTNAPFAAQQMASQPAIPELPVVPSRFSPENMSFTGLFKNEAEGPVETSTEGDGGAFFTQLYAQ